MQRSTPGLPAKEAANYTQPFATEPGLGAKASVLQVEGPWVQRAVRREHVLHRDAPGRL